VSINSYYKCRTCACH